MTSQSTKITEKYTNKPWGRATTLEQFNVLHDKLFRPGNYGQVAQFKAHANDVFITTFAKSGTTWLQHIVHGLRSQGDMNFEEVGFVVPCLDFPHPLGVPLDTPQAFEPQAFMTHSTWHNAPKGGRYICSFRNPKDVIISYYRFLENWFFEPGVIDLNIFARNFLPSEDELDDWWLHTISWWEQRNNETVLLLSYEDMVQDLPRIVRKVAKLMGITLTHDLLQKVVHHSSRDFMLAHSHHFDERGVRQLAEKEIGLPFDSNATKVTQGADKSCYRLSPEINALFDSLWLSQIKPRTGWSNYDDLRQAVRLLNTSRSV